MLLLAFIAAAIVKSLVTKLFTRTKLNALLGRSDVNTDGKEKTIDFIGILTAQTMRPGIRAGLHVL